MTLGNRIAALRKAAGLSQEALAAKLGVSRQAIGKWEADASLPGLDNLHQLAKELGVTIDALLAGEEAESAPERREEETAPALSLEGIQALLDTRDKAQRKGQRRAALWLGVPAALAVAALAAGLAWQGGQLAAFDRRFGAVEEQLGSVQSDMAALDGSLAALQGQLDTPGQDQARPAAADSLLASWKYGMKEFSAAEHAVRMDFAAMPRTLTDNCAVQFILALDDGQALTLDGVRNEAGFFVAEGWVPASADLSLHANVTQNGETTAEQLAEHISFGQLDMVVRSQPMVLQSASYISGEDTFTVRQQAGDYEIGVEVYYGENGQPFVWPEKAWVTATLAGEEVLNMPVTNTFVPPETEYAPTLPSVRWVIYYFRFSLEEKEYTLPWDEGYEQGDIPRPQLEYQLHVLDNGGAESTYPISI